MSISKTYNPREVEDKWYQYWLDQQLFTSRPNPTKEPFTIVIPPPNVTGLLHMGHMLNNTIQDVLIRKARMEGKEACWVPGTDHASIATEAKVVGMLKERGIAKKDISRDEFLRYAHEWKDKYGGIILEQLKKLGASCDWSRTRFTMEADLSAAVIEVFVDLYNKGHIYRGVRMVNWDPQGKTALSDEEVIYKEVTSKLFYIRYPVVGSEGDHLVIATTRPETILADTAICVNPNDERYTHLHGKKVRIPFIDREIPVITDTYVAMDFGTGALKVTPAHDLNDYELGLKHKLPVIDILNDDGTLNAKAQRYVGEDRFAVRKKIAKDLEEAGFLEKVEEHKNNVGVSERTQAVIEPKLSMQWWLKMEELSKPALDNVMNDTIQLHPPKFKNMYRSWMENVKDWCISRQLWWGHQIPAYYLPSGEYVVAASKEEALQKARAIDSKLTAADLTQDEDVLDTWFSSWLWPISVFDGFKDPNNADIQYYYPTNVLVTGFDIIFFWVARMIVAGYEYKGQFPFREVYFTGMVRDKQGRKMSKQLGNSPDALALIEQYGADGVRTGMLFSSAAGNDLLFDEKLCEQGRNFSNKIWNAFRLVKGWEVADMAQPESDFVTIAWFKARFNQVLAETEDHFSKFRISDALQSIYKLIRDDFSDHYLEMVKPEYGQPINRKTYESSIDLLEQLLQLVHPFMPFLSEELWQNLRERKEGDSICVAPYPQAEANASAQYIAEATETFEVITQIRNLRNARQLSPKVALPLYIRSGSGVFIREFLPVVAKLANVEIATEDPGSENTVSFVVKSDEYVVTLPQALDKEKERAEIGKELDYLIGFKESVEKKLSNEKFVANAKAELVERERAKLADAEAKIKALQERLKNL
jgi:valyl-tRNA synthetase